MSRYPHISALSRMGSHSLNCLRRDRSDNGWIILFSPASDKYQCFQTSYTGTSSRHSLLLLVLEILQRVRSLNAF